MIQTLWPALRDEDRKSAFRRIAILKAYPDDCPFKGTPEGNANMLRPLDMGRI
jgi:hypothetical protein